MEQLFNIDLKKISSSSKKEALNRKKNFELFLKSGLPNKKNENWKFTDLNLIIKKILNKLQITKILNLIKKLNLINDFDHNYIILINGIFKSCDLKFEEKEKIKVENLNHLRVLFSEKGNNLYNLNKALSLGGFKSRSTRKL